MLKPLDHVRMQVERPGELVEAVGHERLSNNVSNILARLEGELDQVDSKIGESMHVLDLDNDGLVRPTSLVCIVPTAMMMPWYNPRLLSTSSTSTMMPWYQTPSLSVKASLDIDTDGLPRKMSLMHLLHLDSDALFQTLVF